MSLVCWSGGCDSTLVLYDLARQATPDAPVRALTLTCSQIPADKEQERARTRIKAWFKKKGLHITHDTITVESDGEGFESSGNPQAVLWLYASQYLKLNEHLYTGYHRGDDFWHNQHALQAAFEAMQKYSNRTGQWLSPLEYDYKSDIIRRLKHSELYKLCWYCSSTSLSSWNPKGGESEAKERVPATKPCGKCQSCLTHRTALYELSLQEERTKLSEGTVKMLRRALGRKKLPRKRFSKVAVKQ